MYFITLLNLKLRKVLWGRYLLFNSVISKIGISKIRMGKSTLGERLYLLFNKVLHFKLPEPIKANGMIMYHRAIDGRGWFGWCYAFDYERQTRRIFEKIIKPGMTVVDVGANIGYYTLLAAKLVGGDGRVYAFEPDPSYYSLLKKNIEVNRLSAIAEPFRLAVGDTGKKSTLFLGIATGTSFFRIPGITGQTVIADVVSLDKFFMERNWPAVQIIKIDIEGAEKMALEGMHELLRKNQDLKLIIELNPFCLEIAGTSSEHLLILLSELGFKRITIISETPKFYRIPQATRDLLNFVQKPMYVNLLCER